MSEETEKPCPTQHGQCVGYIVEYQTADKVWKQLIPTESNDGFCIQRSHYPRGEYIMAGVMGFDAAMAFAWAYKANSDGILCKARIVPFRIKYDMEAWRQDDDIVEIDSLIGIRKEHISDPAKTIK